MLVVERWRAQNPCRVNALRVGTENLSKPPVGEFDNVQRNGCIQEPVRVAIVSGPGCDENLRLRSEVFQRDRCSRTIAIRPEHVCLRSKSTAVTGLALARCDPDVDICVGRKAQDS